MSSDYKILMETKKQCCGKNIVVVKYSNQPSHINVKHLTVTEAQCI